MAELLVFPRQAVLRAIEPHGELVATGKDVPIERDFNRLYAEAAREPVELWELPEVNHTDAIDERPAEYERRVVGLFDRALLGR